MEYGIWSIEYRRELKGVISASHCRALANHSFAVQEKEKKKKDDPTGAE